MTTRSKREFAQIALAVVAVFLTVCVVSYGAAGPDRRPNILLIVSEDNGPALGCYGEPHVQTPALDQLAAEGVRFERAYVTQAGCSQSRASFLTGLYPHQNGQIGLATWGFQMYREDTPNVVRSLKEAGYRTGIIGKLHINPAKAFPFDFAEIPSSNFSRESMGEYAEAAARFFAQGDQPFFLSVNYPDAHRPFLRQVGGQPEYPLSGEGIEPLQYIGLDSPKLRRDTVNYYNSMMRLDKCVGDLLAELEDSGKADNTLVIYIGDHGADLLRGKRTSYEGGVRIPMTLRWPGHVEADQVLNELVSTVDLFPTFLDVAEAERIDGLAGRSLAPLVQGKSAEWREHLITEFHMHSSHDYYPQRTVRNDRFKLIWNLRPGQVNPGYDFTIGKFYGAVEIDRALAEAPEDVRAAYALMRQPPEFEVYDLQDDPYEFHNLSDDPAHASILEDLKQQLLEWRKETNDPFLDPANVARLSDEIEARKQGGKIVKTTDPWEYVRYCAGS